MPAFLTPPLLTPESAIVAACAIASPLPVWISGGPGRGAYEVARALHEAGAPTGFSSVRRVVEPAEIERRLSAATDETEPGAPVTLYVESLERQAEPTQEYILSLLDEGLPHRGQRVAVRVIAQTDRQQLTGQPRILRPLRLRLTTLNVALPALDERAAELPAIARALACVVAIRHGLAVPDRTEEDWRRMGEGAATIEDIEARLLSSMIAPGGPTSGAPVPTEPALTEPVPARPRTDPASADPLPEPAPAARPHNSGFRLEAILTELAHEFKNPMVTIKTFAQHIDRLVTDVELRERFSRLTTEAVARMDGFLGELLQYSRFGRPAQQNTALREMIERALADSDAELRQRVDWNGVIPDRPIATDPEQMSFALRLLLRGFSRELPAHAPVVLTSDASGNFIIRTPTGPKNRKLQSHLEGASRNEPETSLHFAVATELIQRNGGELRLVRSHESLEAHLILPGSQA